MELINLEFSIFPSGIPENLRKNESAEAFSVRLAEEKAADIAAHHPNAIVIGADTVVVLDGEILGKPETSSKATTMLRTMRNQTHQVLTGVALVKTDEYAAITNRNVFFERTEVTFGNIADAEIEEYVASGSPMDKAGAYGIQDDWGALFVQRIDGDYYNVVGFPLHRFYQELKTFAPALTPHPH